MFTKYWLWELVSIEIFDTQMYHQLAEFSGQDSVSVDTFPLSIKCKSWIPSSPRCLPILKFNESIYLIKCLAVVIHLCLSREQTPKREAETLVEQSSSFHLSQD